MKTSLNRLLGLEHEKQFLTLANKFSTWLDTANKGVEFKVVKKDEDWIVSQDPVTREIIFNIYILKKCPLEYFGTILIHELVHVFFQGVPNKSDVRHLKEGYGDTSLRILDIQADLYTARFYHECLGLTYREFTDLLFLGQAVFRDDKIRKGKFERFLGTHLTLYHYFAEKDHDLQFLIVPEVGNYGIDGQIKFLETGSKLYRYTSITVPLDLMGIAVYLYEDGQDCDAETYFVHIKQVCKRFYSILT